MKAATERALAGHHGVTVTDRRVGIVWRAGATPSTGPATGGPMIGLDNASSEGGKAEAPGTRVRSGALSVDVARATHETGHCPMAVAATPGGRASYEAEHGSNRYTAPGGDWTVFRYNFTITDPADIVVGAEGEILTLGTDYTVSGVGDPAGGHVMLTTPPAKCAAIQFRPGGPWGPRSTGRAPGRLGARARGGAPLLGRRAHLVPHPVDAGRCRRRSPPGAGDRRPLVHRDRGMGGRQG